MDADRKDDDDDDDGNDDDDDDNDNADDDDDGMDHKTNHSPVHNAFKIVTLSRWGTRSKQKG